MTNRWAKLAVSALLVTGGSVSAASAETPAMPRVDEDADRRDDLVVLREASNQVFWLRSRAGYLPESVPPLPPILGDWDGDRSTDLGAVAFTSPLQWAIPVRGVFGERWGEPTDDPWVVADYSGDGRTDIVVYRPGTPSVWHINTLGHGPNVAIAWGEGDDIPVPGDYDGDGRADIAIARPTAQGTLLWFIRFSSGGSRVVEYGDSDDFIVPGDFDGDGRTDLVVTRDTGGVLTWFILGSSSGFRALQFGNTATDYEVPGDYDGDGRTDIAVWREGAPGTFFILNSSTGGMRVQAWGTVNDYPLANLYVRFGVSTTITAAGADRPQRPAR
jgi:hypothetical protein